MNELNKTMLVRVEKSVLAHDPLMSFFTNPSFDALVQSKNDYKPILQGVWSTVYPTKKMTFDVMDVRESISPSYLTSLAIRNSIGAHINTSTGGVSPMAAASSSVGLLAMSNHFTVSPEEVHDRNLPPTGKGITLSPQAVKIRDMADLYARKLARLVGYMQQERDLQALHVLTRGSMPSTNNPDVVAVDWKKIQKAQVGVYEIPKAAKRPSGTIMCLSAAKNILTRAAAPYLNGPAEYVLVCNPEFVHDMLTDPVLVNAFTHQQMSTDVNPLFTGSIMPLLGTIRTNDGSVIRLVEDNIDYTYIARKSDGTLEEHGITALPRMATSGTTEEKNIAKPAKPSARMICISPNQFLNVVGLLYDADKAHVGQRVSVETSAHNTMIRCLVEYTWLPVSLLPFLAMDITLATDDTAGYGKLKKVPSVFDKES